MESFEIRSQKTSRFFLSGDPSGNFKSICIALHGYGQLAPFFSANFRSDLLKDTLFVIPEALNRFYLNGSKGRVGATWMTREDRLNEIRDYCEYMEVLAERIDGMLTKDIPMGVLGFSQGVATACRWLAHSRREFAYLINWAGVFPPDLDHQTAVEKMQNVNVHMVVGSDDPYISKDKFEGEIDFLREKGYSVKEWNFEGEHRLNEDLLVQIMQHVNPR